MTEYSASGLRYVSSDFNRHSDFCRKALTLTIKVPPGKQRVMRKLLKPFVRNVPALMNTLEVVEEEALTAPLRTSSEQPIAPPPYSISRDQLSSPAIALILMLPDDGANGVHEVKAVFNKIPWQLHHAIQIQDKNSMNVIGSQEFYFMSRSFPLWSAIASPGPSRRLRIQLFVRRYDAMVEFYRLVTNSEMESQKHGFCVFPLNSDSCCDHVDSSSIPRNHNLTPCELALKQCAHVNPYPLSDISLIFPVQNFEPLRTLLQSRVQPLSSRHYLVHDPDGNAVVLYDTSYISTTESIPSTFTPSDNGLTSKSIQDKISAHTESIDSGHFSDFDFV